MTALATWVQAQDKTVETLAGELECHRTTLHRYMSGAKMPRPAVARRIEALTKGVVTVALLNADYVGVA